MRTVRSLTFRASPDTRELALVRAMAIEVLRTIDRIRRGLECYLRLDNYSPATGL